MYVYSLNNYETAKKNLVKEGGTVAVKQNKLAVLEISQIAVWETIVDTYGDVPYTEALKSSEESFSPKYDDAKSIYTSLLSRIDAAVASIDVSQAGYSSGDLVYSGNMTKWKHLANSIKLRLALNLADTDAAAAKAAAESAIASGVISSESESYTLKFDGGTYTNPVFDDLVASGRTDFLPTDLLINPMNAKNDPRRATWFTTVGGNYVGGVFGTLNSYEDFSHMSDFFIARDATANLLSYTEVLFMEAEAAQRGYSVGGTAASFYNQAIAASMAENNVSAAESTAYIAASTFQQRICCVEFL
jgi:hypothetical protein